MTKSQVFLTQQNSPGLRFVVQALKVFNTIYVFIVIQTVIFVFLILVPFMATFLSNSASCTFDGQVIGIEVYTVIVACVYVFNIVLYFVVIFVDGGVKYQKLQLSESLRDKRSAFF
jgi:hypothetical protein